PPRACSHRMPRGSRSTTTPTPCSPRPEMRCARTGRACAVCASTRSHSPVDLHRPRTEGMSMTAHSRPTVLITAAFDAGVADSLADAFDVVVVEPTMDGSSLADRGIDAQLATADVVVAELDVVDERALSLAPELKAVVS